MNLAVGLAAAAGLAALLALGCAGDEEDASGKLSESQVFVRCLDPAREAANRLQVDGWRTTEQYEQFTALLADLGTPFGVPRDTDWSGFEPEYRRVTSRSAYLNEDAGAEFERELKRCAEEFASQIVPDATEEWFAPPFTEYRELDANQTQNVDCTARALARAIERHGLDALTQTSDYEAYLENDGVEPSLVAERAYEDATGRSARVSSLAVRDFRTAAQEC